MIIPDILLNKYTLIGIAVTIVAIAVTVFFFVNKQENLENTPTIDSNVSTKKTLHYYGGKHCPHSRESSPMHKLITQVLKNKYNDVNVIIYWSDENEKEFTKNNVEFVPTILNNNNENVFIGLPEGTKTENHSDDILEEMLLENIYNQL